MRFQFYIFFLLVVSFCWIGCEKRTVQTDSVTSGRLTVLTDESYFPILKAESDAFQNLYENVSINLEVVPQEEAISKFLKGNADMMIIGRELNDKEKEYFIQKNRTFGTNKIAVDAITLLVHENFPDSIVSMDILRKILSGDISRWNELQPSLPDAEIQIVVDKSSSGNLAYLIQKTGLETGKVKIYAAGSNEKVFATVRENNRQIGIVGANWISDEDDHSLKEKLKGLKVLAVSDEKGEAYQPVQENLWAGRYPLVRPVYCIAKTVKTDVVAGFTSFLMSDPGQRIILKEGLLPAIMPEREIVIVKK